MAPNKRKILDSARKYVQKGAKDKALKEYDKLLKLDPRDAKLRLEIGDAHRRWGQVDEAVAAYTKVAEQYMDEGFDARAVAVFKQIQGLDPERWSSYVPLADLYQRMGLNSEAVQALQTAADGLHKAGEKKQALELLRKMATLDPANTTSRIKIADLLKQEEMHEEALAEYDAASVELERQGEAETAEKVYERILEIDSDRIATLTALGRNLVERGHAPRAEPFVKRALEIEPDETNHYELMADVYRAQGRDTELAENYRTLADIFRERGDTDRAREIIQRFVPPEDLVPMADDPVEDFAASGDLLEEELLDEEELLEEDDLLEEVDLSDPIDAAGDSQPLEDENGAPELLTDEQIAVDDEPELLTDEKEAGDEPDLLADEDGAEDEPELLTDDDDDAVLELGLDAGVEVPEEAPAQVPLPTTQPAGVPADADPDQLLAEASVYLRYGKRAQAIRNLETVLGMEPDHRGALEKLGEAHADGGDSDRAVEAWVRAAELALAEGDAAAVGVLRDRVSALEPDALDRMPAVGEDAADDGVGADEIEELIATSAADEAVPDAGEADDGEALAFEDDIEIDASDLEDEIEIEIDAGEGVAGDALDEALDTPLADADDEAEGDAALTLDDEPLSLQEAAAESSQTATGAGSSLSVSAQVNEDIEEAEFYWQQGLRDEAEAIYQRILELAPNHSLAQVRLGEIEAERGGDPGTAEAAAMPQAEPTLEERPALQLDDDVDEALAEDAAPELDVEEPSESEELAADEPDLLSLEDDAEFAIDENAAVVDASGTDEASPSLDDEGTVEEDAAAIEAPIATADDGSEEDPALALDEEPEVEEDATGLASDDDELALDDDATDSAIETSDADLFGDDSEAPPVLADDGVSDAAAAELTLGEDEAAAAPTGEADPAGASFDLAAELSDFFDDSSAATPGATSSTGLGKSAEQDVFAAVFSEFKKGVSEQLGDGDHEAHYDLGIAYREMGLLEDAVGEFEAASGSESRRLECLHLLGLCTLDLGRGDEAVGYLQQALEHADPTGEQVMPLRFDLGSAYETVGRLDEARSAWEAVAEVDPSFGEVEERLARLGDEKPEASADGEMESFEEFFEDDEADPNEATGEVEVSADHESFEDLIAEANAEDDPEPPPAAAPEATEAAPAAEPDPEPEPDPAPARRRKKKKISFV